MAHFPNPAAAGPILADEVVTIYANWTPFFRTTITDDELYCSQQEEPRVRPQHLPRDDRRRQKDVCWPAISVMKRTWSTNCSIPVKRDWPVCFLCSLILARRACRKRWSQESVRRR